MAEMAEMAKRKADEAAGGAEKRTKTKKQWRVPRNGGSAFSHPKAIQPGDSGIWVTCNKGKEAKCTGEMMDLFHDYAEQLYPQPWQGAGGGGIKDETVGEGDADDIEKEIQAEVDDIRKPNTPRLFTPMHVNVQCVIFFKTVAPVEPVSFVKAICEGATHDTSLKRTRFAKRLSPMTLMGRASVEGLEKVATEVLQPHFHREPFVKRKFAIRPSIRNHNILTRDSIIKQVATIVGPGHQVDLTNHELLILVEVYQNVCGIGVVDDSFERLKRYNISEIFEPTPKEESVSKKDEPPQTDDGVKPGDDIHQSGEDMKSGGDIHQSGEDIPSGEAIKAEAG